MRKMDPCRQFSDSIRVIAEGSKIAVINIRDEETYEKIKAIGESVDLAKFEKE